MNITLQNDLTRHTKNNIAILKNNKYNITKQKTKLLHTKQQYNMIRYKIVTETIVLYHCNITIQYKKTQNNVRKNRQYCNNTKQHNKTQNSVII